MPTDPLKRKLTRSILLACVPARPDREALDGLLRSPRIDWGDLYLLGSRHQMLGIVAPILHELLDGKLPELPAAPWQSRWRALAMSDLSQRAALREILEKTRQKGIALMLLKGLSLQAQAYAGSSLRSAADLDLLVGMEQVGEMVRCLEKLGFVLQARDPRGRLVGDWTRLTRRTSEAVYHRTSDAVAVDLHWSLCAPVEEWAAGLTLSRRIWRNARTVMVDGVAARVPGREEELLLLCLHLLKGGSFHLRGLADLVRLLSSPPPPDWDRLAHVALETGTGPMAFHALGLAAQIPGPEALSPVGNAIRRRLSPPWSRVPSLSLDRLIETQGTGWLDLGIRWKGVLFARRPWIWLPYLAALHGKSALRRFGGMIRGRGANSSAG